MLDTPDPKTTIIPEDGHTFLMVSGILYYKDTLDKPKEFITNSIVTVPDIYHITAADIVHFKASLAKSAYESMQISNVNHISILSITPLGNMTTKQFDNLSELENVINNKSE